MISHAILFGFGFFIGFALFLVFIFINISFFLIGRRPKVPRRAVKRYLKKLIKNEEFEEAAIFQRLLDGHQDKSKIPLPKGYKRKAKLKFNRKGPKMVIRINRMDENTKELEEKKGTGETEPKGEENSAKLVTDATQKADEQAEENSTDSSQNSLNDKASEAENNSSKEDNSK